MLELIFQGMIEWLYGLILETWEYFFSSFVNVLNVNFDYLRQHVPIIPEIMQVMLAVGWALLLGNLVFQAAKSMMTGLGFEGEDPKLLFTRSFVFAFLLFASPEICQIGLNMTAEVIRLLDVGDAVDVHLVGDGVFGALGASWLLTIVINVVLMFKVLRFLLEIVERYLVLAFLTICAPLAFGVGGSRNTSDIFTGWCRMFASMCFMMVSNMICFKLLLSLLSNVPAGVDILLWIALVFGVVKVAQKADAIITRIGLNPAITGDGLGGRSLPGILAYTVMRTMVSNAVRTAGKNMAKGGSTAGKGAEAKAGKPNYGGTAAAKGASARPGAAAKGKASTTTNTQSTASNTRAGTTTNNQSKSTVNHPVTVIPDDAEDAALNGQAPSPAASSANQRGSVAEQGGTAKTAERRTSVPAGVTRAPSVVKQESRTGANGKNAANRSSQQVHTITAKSGQSNASTASGQHGAAGKNGTASVRTSHADKSVQPGTAGTGAASRQSGADNQRAHLQHGTAGTASQSVSAHAAQATRNAAQSNTVQNQTQQMNTANSNGASKSATTAKNTLSQTRYTQRPANSGRLSVTSSHPGTAGTAAQAAQKAVPTQTAPPKAGVSSAVSAKASGNEKAARSSGAAPAPSAPQESRYTHLSSPKASDLHKGSSPAPQETRPARQSDSRVAAHHSDSIPAPQESRLKATVGAADQRTRPGTTGIAPSSARAPRTGEARPDRKTAIKGKTVKASGKGRKANERNKRSK